MVYIRTKYYFRPLFFVIPVQKVLSLSSLVYREFAEMSCPRGAYRILLKERNQEIYLNAGSRSRFLIKLLNWEFWPVWIVYIPVALYVLWLTIRSRSLLFFSAANPSIITGGLFGESKIEILDKVPDHLKPETLFFPIGTATAEIVNAVNASELSYPIIAKPNIGERAFLVEKIDSQQELENYLERTNIDVIIQEFIGFPEEVSVMYYRLPSEEKGKVVSVTLKEFLNVIGDGKHTVEELLRQMPRGIVYLDNLKERYPETLKYVPGDGERVQPGNIGNHLRGVTFLNGNNLINDKMNETFDQLAKQLEGIYCCRFDLRCEDLEQLYTGEVMILEVNGVGAEPIHIYDPGYSIISSYKDFLYHWKTVFRIARENRKNGVPYMKWRDFWALKKSVRAYRKVAVKHGIS